MGIDFPSSLSASAGQKFTYSGQEYEFNGTAWKKVRDKVISFNGATGAIVGVTSVQGKTGDVTLTDLEITHGVETFNGLSGSVEGVSTFNGATGAIIGVTSVQGKTGDVTLTDLEITHGVETFNGLSGSIDTTSLVLPVAGISGPSAITFDNGEVIRNSPDGSIQIIPSDEGGNHFGIEIDATEWGFGPVINVIDESGTQVTKAIRLDTDITFSNTNVPDGSPARLMFGNGSDRGFQQNNNNDGTVMFGVNGDNGHFAVGRKADLSDGDRSMSTDDKTALGMSNPQFLVYSSDSTNADDYIRLEHDQTDANIYSGTGGINLVPLSGAVGISGGGLDIKANGITFADGTFQNTAPKTGYRYVIDTIGSGALSSTPSAGTIDVTQQFAGIIDKISIHDTDADGNDISSLLTIFADAGGYLQVMTADNLELFVAHISPADLADNSLTHTFGSDVFVLQHTSDGIEMIGLDTFESGDEVFVTIVPASSAVTGITDSTRGTTNALSSFMFLDGSPVNSGGLSAGHHSNFNRLFIDDEVKLNLKGVTLGTGHLAFNDETLQKTATKDVGTFTISASSAISTGAKADALHRIPYNATLTKFELKSKATGGMTAAVYIAGGDFGDPTTGFVTGATAETAGLTGETTTFGTASVNEGDFVYLHVLANESGATAAQAFVSYETRA